MLPRDMAKIGLLLCNDGKWNNKQIVTKEWLHKSTKPCVAESDFFNYGYQWWHRSKENKQWWVAPQTTSEREHDMVLALGWGGQFIIVVKDLNLVVTTTASDYENDMSISKVPMVIEDIVPMTANFNLH
jgi:CubicO group peptidase (beta-lactamase class C family)